MTLQTWKDEFYLDEAYRITRTLEALLHGIRKWRGLRAENLARHGLRLELGTDSPPKIYDPEIKMLIDADSCALCAMFLNPLIKYDAPIRCEDCPLRNHLGHPCDGLGENKPYGYFWETGDPEPMLAALEEAFVEYCIKNEHFYGFGNMTLTYCLQCLTPTMEVVRPGIFRCNTCGG